jgi:hypothetical protein
MEHFSASELKKWAKGKVTPFAKDLGFTLINFDTYGNQYLSYQRKQTYGWDSFSLRIVNNSVQGFSIDYRFEEIEALFCMDGIKCKQKDIYCRDESLTFSHGDKARFSELPGSIFGSWAEAENYLNAYLELLRVHIIPQAAQMKSVPDLFKHIELGPDAFGKEWLWEGCGLHPSAAGAYLPKILTISKLCGDLQFDSKVDLILQKYESMIPLNEGFRVIYEHLQTSILTIRSIEQKYQVL